MISGYICNSSGVLIYVMLIVICRFILWVRQNSEYFIVRHVSRVGIVIYINSSYCVKFVSDFVKSDGHVIVF
jgi:hypothetical protein